MVDTSARAGNKPRASVGNAPAIKSVASNAIDTALVARLAKLLQDTDLGEIEVEKGDLRIKIVRHSTATMMQQGAPMAAAPMQVVHALPASKAPTSAATAREEVVQSGEPVPAPMVGTAYLRASPEAKPFIEIGSKVAAGDRIMLIEAMKTFNDILSPRAGTVTAILVNDGQPVEYGQPLMIIE
ncbi:MAG: acetyl-CoA carboxylase biotin carboxyl carrier protein [Hyphomicrobiales bacterium]|nr:acetyl-CoA carboxylase biotin carboxyl carrier protein [Hyphomicrobiales bacterium]